MPLKEIVVSQQTDSVDGSSPLPTELHLLNCKFEESTTDSKISDYFTSQLALTNNVENVEKHGGNNLKISFRGRPLNGRKITLPGGYSFARVGLDPENVKSKALASDLTREAYYWNLDKIPSSSDVLPQAVQWIQLAGDIHSHIELEDD